MQASCTPYRYYPGIYRRADIRGENAELVDRGPTLAAALKRLLQKADKSEGEGAGAESGGST